MLPSLALVTVLAAVPGISLRVIEEGSPPGPPSAWVLGEEVVSAWEVTWASHRDGELTFSVPTRCELRERASRGCEVALVVVDVDGAETPLLRAHLRDFMYMDELPADGNALATLHGTIDLGGRAERWSIRIRRVAPDQDVPPLRDSRLLAVVSQIQARGRLLGELIAAARRAGGSVMRDGHQGRWRGGPPWSKPPRPLFTLDRRDVELLESLFLSDIPAKDLLRWWTDGPEPLRPFAIAVLAAYHAPSCLDLLRDEALHAPDAERRGRARLALAAAGDREQAAYLRARLVNDAPAEVGVVDAALALAALGDVGALDGVRAVAADWQSRDERMLLAVRALEQALAVRALARD